MHHRSLLATAGLVVLTAGCAASARPVIPAAGVSAATSAARTVAAFPSAHASTSTSTPAPARTRQVVLRPVTATGTPAAGFTANPQPSQSIVCLATIDDASPVAVDDNIDVCSPNSLSPLACWPGAKPGTAL